MEWDSAETQLQRRVKIKDSGSVILREVDIADADYSLERIGAQKLRLGWIFQMIIIVQFFTEHRIRTKYLTHWITDIEFVHNTERLLE